VGRVGDPWPVGGRRAEVTVDQVGRPGGSRGWNRGSPALTPDRSLEFEFGHQPTHPVPTNLDTLAPQLLPDLLCPVDVEVLLMHASDLDLETAVAQLSNRWWPRHCRVVSRRGDLQRVADRLDPKPFPVFVDEAHYFGSRGSSSLAKKADAALRISLARRSSRTSFSSSAIRCWSLVVIPGRCPLSISACLTQ